MKFLPIDLRPDRCGFIAESAYLGTLHLLAIIETRLGAIEEHYETFQQCVVSGMVIIANQYTFGGRAELAAFERWRRSVEKQGTFRAVDCDGKLIEREI